LGYKNDRLIQIETLNFDFILSKTAELIKNEVANRYLESLKDKSKIYPVAENSK